MQTQHESASPLFTGAGAQQQYLLPYMHKVGGWSPVACAWVIAAVYGSMMIFRIGNLFLLRRLPLWLWTIVGSSAYLFFTLACMAVAWHRIYALAIAGAVIWGWGAAAFWGGTTIQTLNAADRGRLYGTGTGILYAASQAGWVIGLFVLGQVYANFQDQPWMLYLVAACITLPGVLITPFLSRQNLPDLAAIVPSFADIVDIMFRAKALILAFLLASTSLCFGIILGIGDFVEQEYGPQWIWVVAIFYPFARLLCSLLSGIPLAPGLRRALHLAGTGHRYRCLAVQDPGSGSRGLPLRVQGLRRRLHRLRHRSPSAATLCLPAVMTAPPRSGHLGRRIFAATQFTRRFCRGTPARCSTHCFR